jgi:hypothetical protein
VERLAKEAGHIDEPALPEFLGQDWIVTTGWQQHVDRPWGFSRPQAGIALAGEAIWSACGIGWDEGEFWTYPRRANPWGWWALLDFPLRDEIVSLLWDGDVLYSTRQVFSDQPVEFCTSIHARNAGELDFDLHFEMKVDGNDTADGGPERSLVTFRPVFDAA